MPAGLITQQNRLAYTAHLIHNAGKQKKIHPVDPFFKDTPPKTPEKRYIDCDWMD